MTRVKRIEINIPKFPRLIIDTLKSAGFDAYIVGGCVRDQLLGIVPSDFDITTNAKPDEIKKLFKRTIDTGIKHGTVSVLFYDKDVPHIYEVTTYRIDGEYFDGRHPKSVTFVDDLKEDLRRRDFTVNAMAYNYEVGLVDEFGGLKDLGKKLIRAVGDPYERFSEDALRLFRAIRFAAKLGFDIEKKTADTIPKLAKNLESVSKERIQIELTKTITSKKPHYISLSKKYGLDRYICAGFEKIKFGKFMSNLSIYLAYTCMLYNTNVDDANRILRSLKLDNSTISKVLLLLSAKDYYQTLKACFNKHRNFSFDFTVKECINFLGYDLAHDFIELLCINEGNNGVIKEFELKIKYYEKHKIPIFIKDLDVDGNDLSSIGFSGKEIGVALKNLQKIVYNNCDLNNKKLLQDIAMKAYNIYKNL